MKSRLLPLSLAALLAAPVALAHVANFKPFDQGAADKIGPKVTETLDQMQQEFNLGAPIQTSLGQLSAQIEQMPGSAELRARLSSHVQDLADRAGQAYLEQEDLARLRIRIVDTVVDEALAELRRQAVLGKWSPDQAAGVFSAWAAQARVFVDAPDPAAYRARVTQAAEIATIGATSASAAIGDMQLMLLQGQLEDARLQLRQRVEEGLDSRSDYLRLYDLMSRRARLVSSQPPGQ